MRFFLVGALALAACGSKANTFDGTDAEALDEGIASDAPSLESDGGAPGDSGMMKGCSSDLRQVLDGQGNVLQTCDPDKGCAGGQCVPACQAAGAAKGSVGCDFAVATPSFYAGSSSYYNPCFAVFLANNWPLPAKITVTRGGQSYNVTQFGRVPQVGVQPAQWPAVPSAGLPSGQVAVLFMSQAPNTSFKCPIAPAISMGTAVQDTGRGEAFRVAVDVPVSAYDILPFGGASSLLPGATLLLPTTAWGTNYIAVVPKLGSGTKGSSGGPHWGQIVAAEDGTVVDVVPTVALPAGSGVNGAPQNVKSTFTLKKNEIIQWQPPYQGGVPMDISGSIISSNKPVAFNGGNGYLCLGSQTSTGGGCDSDHEQIPPVQALGSEYVAAPHMSRLAMGDESLPYRIVGAVNGTTLTYDPPVPGAPTQLKLAQMVEFEAKGAFTVKSQDAQHPFYLGQMMPGCTLMGAGLNNQGDEEYLNVLPPAQFLKQYVFFTDPTYTTTTFTLVRSKTSQGFRDVKVDCVGTVTGWKNVGNGGQYQQAVVTIIKENVPMGNCQNGPHSASSDGPFGLTVWGLSYAASYGYPAGGNVASINTVTIPPVPPN